MHQNAERSVREVPANEMERALEELHPICYGWALMCARWDHDEAEEVVQTTYLKVLDGHARFCGGSSLKTWLFGVIRYTAIERRRKSLLRKLLFARFLQARGGNGIRADLFVSPVPNGNEELVATLRRLPMRQQEVLHLVFYEDLTIEEAARLLGISVGSARMHYSRGKMRLRDALRSKETGS